MQKQRDRITLALTLVFAGAAVIGNVLPLIVGLALWLFAAFFFIWGREPERQTDSKGQRFANHSGPRKNESEGERNAISRRSFHGESSNCGAPIARAQLSTSSLPGNGVWLDSIATPNSVKTNGCTLIPSLHDWRFQIGTSNFRVLPCSFQT